MKQIDINKVNVPIANLLIKELKEVISLVEMRQLFDKHPGLKKVSFVVESVYDDNEFSPQTFLDSLEFDNIESIELFLDSIGPQHKPDFERIFFDEDEQFKEFSCEELEVMLLQYIEEYITISEAGLDIEISESQFFVRENLKDAEQYWKDYSLHRLTRNPALLPGLFPLLVFLLQACAELFSAAELNQLLSCLRSGEDKEEC